MVISGKLLFVDSHVDLDIPDKKAHISVPIYLFF